MAKSDLLSSLSILSRRIDGLLEERDRLLDKIRELDSENRELKAQKEQDLLLLENSRKDIEFLSMSHRLADSPEALVEARNKISKLVRTIDSCIRLLKED